MLEKQKISVLMSVYVKENPTFLRDAINSIQNQTLKPSELVLVEDGPLTPELYQVLDQVEAESDIPVKRCPLEENQGLGLALRYGVLHMVLKAGNYEDGLYMEDDLLWLNMIAAGAKTGNLDQILCQVRVGAGMFERRGGLRYLKLYRQARQRMLKRGQISYMEYAKSVAIQMLVALCPGFVRQFIFMKLLRKSK